MRKHVVVLFLSILVVYGGFAQNSMTPAPGQDQGMMKSSGTASDSGMMKSDKAMTGFYDVAALGPSVALFTTEKEAEKMAMSKTVVYFFAATWCPDCQATYKDLKMNFKSLPSNLMVLFVNYDQAKDLEKKYGITMQHTFVSIDAMGKAKKVWVGTSTAALIAKNALSAM